MKIELNPQQKQAVMDTEGAILVIAGAGSGKTRVLTERICHLIELGVSPYNILALTFTNKAANEMKERIERSIGASQVWTSTFHSLCARILRIDIDKLGYTKDFTIYTEQESDRVVKRVLMDMPSIDPKKKGEYLWHISRAKTLALSPDEYYDEIKHDDNDAFNIKKVYVRYEEELKRSNSLDYDDLLLKTVQLFEEFPDVLEKYRRRFLYTHVDEFQDTNRLQYKIMKMIASGSGNVFAVGDEDQSIYSWRGADIRNILEFEKDFKGAKIYKLEQNYRSTTSILKAANRVIKNNSRRKDKTLWSDINDDDPIVYYEAYSDRDEAEQVARTVDALVKEGLNYSDIAVLVRANSLTRLFEEEFNLHSIPYKVFGGFRFFERKEIKDALAYVRLAINPHDSDSLLRIINYPRRGIGETTVRELINAAAKQGISVYEVLISGAGLSAATVKKLTPFKACIDDIIAACSTMRPTEFMQYVVRKSGIETFLSTSTDIEDATRLDNVQELVNAVSEFEKDNPELGISEFMQSVALVSDTDEMDDQNYVSIATIHAVKGLEFEAVFIVGLEEGIFPSQRAIISGDIEEERRLMYVAITRAKRKLYVVNSRSRYRFGKTEYMPKSRFIGEMSGVKQTMRYTNSGYGAQNEERIKLGANASSAASVLKGGAFTPQKKSAPSTSNGADLDKFVKNTVVEHTKFGRGIIVETSGEGEDKIAAIAFKGLGVKRFALAIAAVSLKIVDDQT